MKITLKNVLEKIDKLEEKLDDFLKELEEKIEIEMEEKQQWLKSNKMVMFHYAKLL